MPPAKTRAKPRPPTRRPVRGALREQAREVYREAILEAAAEELAERGFASVRMQDVARRAGLAIGTLYNYFPGKAELTASLMELRARQYVGLIDAMLAALPRDGSAVEGAIRIALGHIEQHRALFVLFEDGALAGTELGNLARCDELQQIFRGAMRKALGVAQARGELRRGLALDEVCILIGGMIHGLARAWIATGGRGRLDARAPLLLDVCLHGVGRP